MPGEAAIGPPGTRALHRPDGAEFAHLHPDGSLHLVLPPALAYDALVKGWALAHPLAGVRASAGLVLVPAPRDAAERDVVVAIVAAAAPG